MILFYVNFVDLLVGLFIRTILKLRGVPENLSMLSVIVWLFNPFTFTIGTRGNCEPIVCALVLWVFICLMNGVSFFLCIDFYFYLGNKHIPKTIHWLDTHKTHVCTPLHLLAVDFSH